MHKKKVNIQLKVYLTFLEKIRLINNSIILNKVYYSFCLLNT